MYTVLIQQSSWALPFPVFSPIPFQSHPVASPRPSPCYASVRPRLVKARSSASGSCYFQVISDDDREFNPDDMEASGNRMIAEYQRMFRTTGLMDQLCARRRHLDSALQSRQQDELKYKKWRRLQKNPEPTWNEAFG